jgi:hypothetical protein
VSLSGRATTPTAIAVAIALVLWPPQILEGRPDEIENIEVRAEVAASVGIRSLGDLEVDLIAGGTVVVDPVDGGSALPGSFELVGLGGVPLEVRVAVHQPEVAGLDLKLGSVAVRGSHGRARVAANPSAFRLDTAELDRSGRVVISVGYELHADSDLPEGVYAHPVAITIEATPQLGT